MLWSANYPKNNNYTYIYLRINTVRVIVTIIYLNLKKWIEECKKQDIFKVIKSHFTISVFIYCHYRTQVNLSIERRFFDGRGTMGTNKRTMENNRIIITKMRRRDQDSITILTLPFSNASQSANGTIPKLSLSPFSCPKMWIIRFCTAMSENLSLSQRCLLRTI